MQQRWSITPPLAPAAHTDAVLATVLTSRPTRNRWCAVWCAVCGSTTTPNYLSFALVRILRARCFSLVRILRARCSSCSSLLLLLGVLAVLKVELSVILGDNSFPHLQSGIVVTDSRKKAYTVFDEKQMTTTTIRSHQICKHETA